MARRKNPTTAKRMAPARPRKTEGAGKNVEDRGFLVYDGPLHGIEADPVAALRDERDARLERSFDGDPR